ncbi:MAG TPA: 2TM domain-containing protein [Polyangiaceae bacterium]|nr:2TM domain-containing protein [Polyangiaceae bacterium]
MARSYSRDEVQAILASAVERQHGQGDQLTHEDLVAIGKELGVSREAIENAAAGIGDDVEVQRQVRIRVQGLRRGFLYHIVPFLLVNLFLATINFLTWDGFDFPWFLFPLLGWAIGLGSHAIVALAPNRDKIEAQVRRRIEREREKQRRRNERGALSEGARRVAEAVHDRTAEMLHAVADALEDRSGEDASKVRVEPRAAAAAKPRVDVRAAADTAAASDEADAADEAAPRRSAR